MTTDSHDIESMLAVVVEVVLLIGGDDDDDKDCDDHGQIVTLAN